MTIKTERFIYIEFEIPLNLGSGLNKKRQLSLHFFSSIIRNSKIDGV